MNYYCEIVDANGFKMGLSKRLECLCDVAYRMFQNGKDTEYIAQHFGIHEALALKRVNLGRSLFINLRSPYAAHGAQKSRAA